MERGILGWSPGLGGRLVVAGRRGPGGWSLAAGAGRVVAGRRGPGGWSLAVRAGRSTSSTRRSYPVGPSDPRYLDPPMAGGRWDARDGQ